MAITTTLTGITSILPQITVVSIIFGVILFLILYPFISFIWTNITAIGQILLFIAGIWVASIFLNKQGR